MSGIVAPIVHDLHRSDELGANGSRKLAGNQIGYCLPAAAAVIERKYVSLIAVFRNRHSQQNRLSRSARHNTSGQIITGTICANCLSGSLSIARTETIGKSSQYLSPSARVPNSAPLCILEPLATKLRDRKRCSVKPHGCHMRAAEVVSAGPKHANARKLPCGVVKNWMLILRELLPRQARSRIVGKYRAKDSRNDK